MDLFSSFRLGPFELRNRIVMAPMNRARSDANRAPTKMTGEYYAQRATVGLIVTEATSVSPLSVSRPGTSAIYEDVHVAGWRQVAERVHAAGGTIFQQLYHLGRKADPSRMPDGATPVAPSAIAAKGKVAGVNGPVDFAVPRALDADEIPGVVEQFRVAAANAKRAGMDGVEIHGANSYLIDQFLRDATNRRVDHYGGSIANRARLLLEIVDTVCDVIGPERVGVRLSPHAHGDGIADSDPVATYRYAAGALNERGIAYLHLVEVTKPGLPQSPPQGTPPVMPIVRNAFGGALIVNGGYDRDSANELIGSGGADLVAFGALMIANPDLVERFRRRAPLNLPDHATFHQGGANGFIDYPALAEAAAAE
jgi:N-ethylmaleimide reductase